MQLFGKLKEHDLAVCRCCPNRTALIRWPPQTTPIVMLTWKYIDQHKSQMEKPIRSTFDGTNLGARHLHGICNKARSKHQVCDAVVPATSTIGFPSSHLGNHSWLWGFRPNLFWRGPVFCNACWMMMMMMMMMMTMTNVFTSYIGAAWLEQIQCRSVISKENLNSLFSNNVLNHFQWNWKLRTKMCLHPTILIRVDLAISFKLFQEWSQLPTCCAQNKFRQPHPQRPLNP